MSELDGHAEHEHLDALDAGLVLRWSAPMQGDMYLYKSSDVGSRAFMTEHPRMAEPNVYSATHGRALAHGIIFSDGFGVNEILTLSEAQERGVFEDVERTRA